LSAPSVVGRTRGAYSLAALPVEHRFGRRGFSLYRFGNFQVDAQTMAVLHERVAAIAELRLLTLALAHEFGVGVGGRGVGRVGAAFASDIDHALIIRPTRIRRTVLTPHTLGGRRPGFDQRAINSEMLVGEQVQLARLTHHRIEEAAGQSAFHQPFAQAREIRLIQPALLQVHVQEPAEQNVVIEHLAEQPIRAHRVQRNQQTGLEQPLRRNRRPAGDCIQFIDIAAQRLEHRVGVTLDRPQWMRRRYPRLRRKVAKHRRLRIQMTTHGVSLSESGLDHKVVDNREISSFASRC
jgi:hypothetical protein